MNTTLKKKHQLQTHRLQAKNTHSVGHFQAQKIFECFQGEDAYENIDNFIPSLFNSSDLLKAYRKIESVITNLDNDIRIQPCKTYIPFYRKNQFAIVKVSKDKKIVIGLNLDETFKNDRFKKSKTGGSEMMQGITFAQPNYLLLLILIPVMIFFYFIYLKKKS
mgnify:CR=1 FL=1